MSLVFLIVIMSIVDAQLAVRRSVQGVNQEQDHVFSYRSPPDHVPMDHPLRRIKNLVNRALKELSRDFNKMYLPRGWPTIPPGKLIRAMLLQVLYSIRNERLLIEQLDYNLLFRWFVGLAMDEEVWDPTTFSKNRKGLLDANILGNFFYRVCEQAQEQGLLSDEYFTVDGTLIEALASQESFPTEGEGSNGIGGGGDE